MKQNLDYYQHFSDADQHAKFKMLRIKYGWEGEGRFWALNNRMATADNCTVDTTKKYQMVTIATDLGMTLKELDEYIDYLDKECDLIIRENDFITTEILQENLGRVMKKREKNQEDYKKRIKESLRNCQRDEKEIQTSENIQSKVKETKSKEKEKEEDNIDQNFERFWSVYPRKVVKKKAKESWIKVNPDNDLAEKIIQAAKRQSETTWKNKEDKYIPHATTWLNGQRWEDEISIPLDHRQNPHQIGHNPDTDTRSALERKREALRMYEDNRDNLDPPGLKQLEILRREVAELEREAS